MSWSQSAGYTRESYTEYPDREEASATLSGITSTAPNRSQTLTASAVDFPNTQTQQGSNAFTSALTFKDGQNNIVHNPVITTTTASDGQPVHTASS